MGILTWTTGGYNFIDIETIQIDKDMKRNGKTSTINIWMQNALNSLLGVKTTKEYFINGVENKEEMLLKPFDLSAAKDGKPVCTKDGRPARIICFDTKGDICPIIALVEDNGLEVIIHYNEEGKSCNDGGDKDLMMAPEISESELMKQTPPRSWEEFCERYPIKKGESYIATSSNIYSAHYDCKERYSKSWCVSKEEAEAFLALMQLRQLRKAWIGDWEQTPHNDIGFILYDIRTSEFKVGLGGFSCFITLSFPTIEMAEDFFSCFKDLCETAKNLL